MAYVEDEKRKRERPAEEIGGGVMSGGSPSAAGAASAAAPRPGKSGGQPFVTLASYLDANRDQVGQTTDRVADGLANQANTVRAGIDSAATKFKTDVDKGVTSFGDPTKSRDIMQQTYGGPQTFADGGLGASVRDLEAARQATQDPTRIPDALKTTFGGQYTSGMSALDVGLIRADPKAQAQLGAVYNQTGGLGAYLDARAKEGNAYVADTQRRVTNNNKAYERGMPMNPLEQQEVMAGAPPGAYVSLGQNAVGHGAPSGRPLPSPAPTPPPSGGWQSGMATSALEAAARAAGYDSWQAWVAAMAGR